MKRQILTYLVAPPLLMAIAQAPVPASAQTVQELLVRWNAYVGAPGPQVAPHTAQPADLFSIHTRRTTPGLLPRQRNPQLSTEQLVVVALDAQGQEVDWQLIPDPRLLRAEHSGPQGELTGEVLHHATTAFLITLPNDPAITQVQLYQPRWTGAGYVFDLLGTLALP